MKKYKVTYLVPMIHSWQRLKSSMIDRMATETRHTKWVTALNREQALILGRPFPKYRNNGYFLLNCEEL